MIDKAKLLEAIERYAAARENLATLSEAEYYAGNDEERKELAESTSALGAALAAVSEPLLDSTVSKAARVLSDRSAERDGRWSNEFAWELHAGLHTADARAMLEAIQ
jgi:hypothetical protein